METLTDCDVLLDELVIEFACSRARKGRSTITAWVNDDDFWRWAQSRRIPILSPMKNPSMPMWTPVGTISVAARGDVPRSTITIVGAAQDGQ